VCCCALLQCVESYCCGVLQCLVAVCCSALLVIKIQIGIVDAQSSCLFSNEPFEKRQVICIRFFFLFLFLFLSFFLSWMVKPRSTQLTCIRRWVEYVLRSIEHVLYINRGRILNIGFDAGTGCDGHVEDSDLYPEEARDTRHFSTRD